MSARAVGSWSIALGVPPSCLCVSDFSLAIVSDWMSKQGGGGVSSKLCAFPAQAGRCRLVGGVVIMGWGGRCRSLLAGTNQIFSATLARPEFRDAGAMRPRKLSGRQLRRKTATELAARQWSRHASSCADCRRPLQRRKCASTLHSSPSPTSSSFRTAALAMSATRRPKTLQKPSSTLTRLSSTSPGFTPKSRDR
jgi:hypothetical protein